MVKNLPAKAEDSRDSGSIPGSGRCPGSVFLQPTPVFLPEEPHGQRSLMGYSPWGRSWTRLKQLSTHVRTDAFKVGNQQGPTV